MNQLAHMIARAARYFGDRTAIATPLARRSFRLIHQRSNQLAHALQALGVQKGHRVGVLLENSIEYVETDFALIKVGAVRVPVNIRLAAREFAFILKDAEVAAVICDAERLPILQGLLTEIGLPLTLICVGGRDHGVCDYEHLLAQSSSSDAFLPVDPADPYQILYTSGTTGKPKGALTNFRSRLTTLATVYADEFNPRQGEGFLLATSMAHGGGTKILPHFLRGAQTILHPKFDPEHFFQTVEVERVAASWLVPTMVGNLLETPSRTNYDLSSLKTIVYAASPMPVERLRHAIELFGPIFLQIYGLSEAPNPVLVLPKEDHCPNGTPKEVGRLASAGREAMFVMVRVVGEDGRDAAPGQLGEIVVGGENIMTEYWRQPEATAETIRNRWLHTGDMATVDEDGYVYIVDRKKDLIISGGYNIYPREVEEVLYRHPSVLEAAVIGVPDRSWGESVKALVVLRSDAKATAEEIIDFCRPHLAGYKKPRSVDFLPELPKSANGKIMHRQLRDRYWQGRDRNIN